MTNTREKILSVSIKDCDVQTFRAGGKGGQAQNKTDSGVRIIHRPSGARGEARDSRYQIQNKRAAFKRMAESSEFRQWMREQTLPPEILAANAEIRESARLGFGTDVRRTYVLHGERMVKDPNTGHKVFDV